MPYSYHVATELSGLLRKLGKFPCVHQSVGTVMFRAAFAPFCEELVIVGSVTSPHNDLRTTYMSIEYLNLAKSWVRKEDARSCLPDEPVPSENIKRGTIQRVGVYSRGDYWKSRKYRQTCSESTATTETVRGVARGTLLYGHAPVEEF